MSNQQAETPQEADLSQSQENVVQSAAEFMQETMDQFMATADVNAVYGETIKHQGNLIIPAAEVVSFMGFGVGGGTGVNEDRNAGSGIGGGGGGKSFARPVAVIVAGESGVEVKPVVDFTKIYLTAFTTLGFITAAWLRMRRGR